MSERSSYTPGTPCWIDLATPDIEATEKFWNQWRVAVGQLHFEPEEFIDSGDTVVVVAKRSGRGEQSGLEVSDRVVQVFSFEGDKCVRVQEFYDRGSALNAVRAESISAES